MRIGIIASVGAGVVALCVWSLGCCSEPAVTALPTDESAIRVLTTEGGPARAPEAPAARPVPAPDAAPPGEAPPAPGPDEAAGGPPPLGDPPTAEGSPGPAPAPAAAPAPAPWPEPLYQALELRGVKGGRIEIALPGTPEQVRTMLLDFENAAGRRSWARAYRTLERGAERVVAEWRFRGKMGINPTVHLAFETRQEGAATTVTYSLVKKAFGIASFFGDYRIEPLPGQPARTRLSERVFIDSGIPFTNAKSEDIEKGLREDARLMRAWMEERTGSGR